MKKYITIAALFAAGTTFANAADSDLVWTDIKFGSGKTLTSGNQAMTWADGTYTDWIIKFSITENETQSAWEPTIACGTATGTASGLAVGVFNGKLRFNNGNGGIEAFSETLSFDVNDVLTFAFSNGSAYIGNYTKGKYISVGSLSGLSADMVSGSSRAWSNGGRTKIGTAQFANLADTSYEGSDTIVSIVVPEPSAFGLLAGLGALALVASRRRRK